MTIDEYINMMNRIVSFNFYLDDENFNQACEDSYSTGGKLIAIETEEEPERSRPKYFQWDEHGRMVYYYDEPPKRVEEEVEGESSYTVELKPDLQDPTSGIMMMQTFNSPTAKRYFNTTNATVEESVKDNRSFSRKMLDKLQSIWYTIKVLKENKTTN